MNLLMNKRAIAKVIWISYALQLISNTLAYCKLFPLLFFVFFAEATQNVSYFFPYLSSLSNNFYFQASLVRIVGL